MFKKSDIKVINLKMNTILSSYSKYYTNIINNNNNNSAIFEVVLVNIAVF
jgi:hypothetical protein